MISSTTSTILEKLRAETRPQHDALENVARSEQLGSGKLSTQEYQALITANYWAHRYLEGALSNNFVVEVLLPDWPKRKKVALLESELERLNVQPEGIWKKAPVEKAPQIQNEAQAWGVLYVMEGSTLGGAVIAKSLHANADLANLMPPKFYGSYGQETGAYWKVFRQRLQLAFTDAQSENQAVKAASQTFDFYAACFKLAFQAV